MDSGRSGQITELEKLSPDARVQPFRERVSAPIKERYQQLLLGNLWGAPVLTVLSTRTVRSPILPAATALAAS
jgi:hypothetical protein